MSTEVRRGGRTCWSTARTSTRRSGGSILGARPAPEQRPRWERVLDHAASAWGASDVRGLFFLNASNGSLPMSFVQALLAIGFSRPLLAGRGGRQGGRRRHPATLEAIAERDGDVLLASHDGDFAPEIAQLLGPGRRVGLLAFGEFVSSSLRQLTEQGLEVFDLEHDVAAFTARLPRVRIIQLEEFDPTLYL